MKNTFKDISRIAYKGDTNCCTVIACSIAFEIDYKEAHSFLKSKGRVNGKGLSWGKIDQAYHEMGKLKGFKVTTYKLYYRNEKYAFLDEKKKEQPLCFLRSKSALTINNFRDYLPKGDYIFGIRRHVLAVKNGAVQDWSVNRQMRIFEIWKIEKRKKVFKDVKSPKHDFSKFI